MIEGVRVLPRGAVASTRVCACFVSLLVSALRPSVLGWGVWEEVRPEAQQVGKLCIYRGGGGGRADGRALQCIADEYRRQGDIAFKGLGSSSCIALRSVDGRPCLTCGFLVSRCAHI